MRWIFVVIIGCGALSGCSQKPYLDASLEVMNAERRGLEDRLYDLEYEYEATVEKLENYRIENEELKRQLAGRGSDPEPLPTTPEFDEDDLTPRIEVPDLGASAGPSSESTVAAPMPMLTSARATGEIRRIEIDPRRLSGVDFDEQPGDDGITITIEPRDAGNHLVRTAGPIHVVVLDYALRGEGNRAVVAEWKLTEAEVTRFLQDSPEDQGIQLHLLWPEDPPEHARLRVNVRFTTQDGRRLDTRRDVTVNLPSQLSNLWTPRAEQPTARVVGHTESPAAEVSSQPPAPADRPEWKPYR